jgi:hypothetical protein
VHARRHAQLIFATSPADMPLENHAAEFLSRINLELISEIKGARASARFNIVQAVGFLPELSNRALEAA